MYTQQPGWWTTLRPGDYVILDQGGLDDWRDICCVERLTKTQLLVANPRKGGRPYRFHLKNGYEVGGDAYHSITIYPCTGTAAAAIRQERAREKLLARLRELKIQDLAALTLEECHAMQAYLNTHLDKEKGGTHAAP